MGKERREVIVVDEDLDGILSGSLYSYLNGKNKIYFLKDLNDLNFESLVAFDIAVDRLKRAKDVNSLNIKNLTIFDHHVASELDLLELADRLVLNLDLFSPSTYDLVKRTFGHKKEEIKEFEKNYKDLIEYMHKAENEDFEKMNKKELNFYFNYYNILHNFLKKGERNFETILNYLKNSLYDLKEVSKEYISYLESEINNLRKKFENSEKSVIFLPEGFPTYILPYFYKDKEYLAIKDLKNHFVVTYRLSNKKLWENYIKKFEGGGRKLYGKNRYVGLFIVKDKKLLGEFLYDFMNT